MGGDILKVHIRNDDPDLCAYCLQVARCTKIINADKEDAKYMINLKPVRRCAKNTGWGSKGSQWIWGEKNISLHVPLVRFRCKHKRESAWFILPTARYCCSALCVPASDRQVRGGAG